MKMVSKARGTFKLSTKGSTGVLWLPAALVKDSQFPLKEGSVEIIIEKDHLIIKQAR
jgi:hypothetical protein